MITLSQPRAGVIEIDFSQEPTFDVSSHGLDITYGLNTKSIKPGSIVVDDGGERLERQRERGQLAEEKVVELEQLRLSSANRADLAAKVQRISINDVSAGFDVKSFEIDESPRYIEVKSSVGSQIVFEWSQGERAKARREGASFYIYFVPFSFSLPTLTSPIVTIKNPVAQISTGALIELPSNYKVMENHPNSKILAPNGYNIF
jgi:hypothetical protein